MSGLGIGLYESPTGQLLLDLAARGQGVTLSTGEHGYQSLRCFVPMSLQESFYYHDRPGLFHVSVTWQGGVVWEGRLEDSDIKSVAGGVELTAFGYWRALSDVTYTALWSTISVADWHESNENNDANRKPKLYSLDTNNRLFVTLTKNSVYGDATDVGGLHYVIAMSGSRLLKTLSFDYAYVLPNNWKISFQRATAAGDSPDGAFSSPVALETLTADGAAHSGSKSYDFSANPVNCVNIQIYNNTGAPYTCADETGALYLVLTNVRVQTTASAGLYADEIAGALVAHVSGINAAQLSTSTALIASPGVDLSDENYLGECPADILDRLARLGDNSTPISLYETGVWDNRRLRFQKRGATARQWYVDVSALELERTIDALYNSVYADYVDASLRTRRTALAVDQASIDRYGLTRRLRVVANSTSSTQAGVQRDAALADGKDPRPRIALKFDALYDASGTRWPLWCARAWDTVTIRNLPPTLSTSIDRIRTFRVLESVYDADADTLTLTPEQYLPTLETMVLRQSAGVVETGLGRVGVASLGWSRRGHE